MKKTIKNFNNRGYVLVEIILASVIAFGIAYYMLDLTVKLKNKNDDLLVETLVKTDQAIIQNSLVRYIEQGDFSCDRININGNVISYRVNAGGAVPTAFNDDYLLIDVVNQYTSVGVPECSSDGHRVNIRIPLTVTALNKHYDVTFNYVPKNHLDDVHGL